MLKVLFKFNEVLLSSTTVYRMLNNQRSASMKLAYDLYFPPGDREQNLPPVILMHGMLDSRKSWKYIAPCIAERTGRKVYAIDARNHGESPWNERITFDENAEDLREFFSQHQILRASIVGHSMGGRTAMAIALNQPQLVEKIVVEDMNCRNFKPTQSGIMVQVIEMLRESLNHIPPGSDERTAKKSVAKYIVSLFAQTTGNEVKRKKDSRYDLSMIPLKLDGSSYSWEANLDALEKMLTTDRITQNLSGVFRGDALFLYGSKSFFKVEKDEKIPKLFPRVTLVGIERATHLLHFEFPDRFIDEVSFFLNNGLELKAKY